ncbi:MAG: hypothetical protein LQ338_008066 [Usnochroma carphineum]|nr:MAG: hypothetical protein LQ338_008066 [Usnochroma carphineum]
MTPCLSPVEGPASIKLCDFFVQPEKALYAYLFALPVSLTLGLDALNVIHDPGKPISAAPATEEPAINMSKIENLSMEDLPVEGLPIEDLVISPITPSTSAPSFLLPLTTSAPHLSPHILRRKDPKTVTETISITISVFDISITTESQLLTVTETVYINKTVFQPVTHTETALFTHTVNQTIPTTILETRTLLPSSTCEPAKATLTPLPTYQGRRLGAGAVAGIAVGSVVGALAVMSLAWLMMRKYRRWMARKNQHLKGVELQRGWEMEQDVRRDMG